MDLGSGLGTTARYAARQFGVSVACVDLNPHANEMNRELTKGAGLQGLVSVLGERSMLRTGEVSNSLDMVFSQDALCHVSDLDKAFEEVARLLVVGGTFAFTDIFADSQVPKSEMQRLFSQLSIKNIRTADFIISTANMAGLELVEFQDDSPSLVRHFTTLKELLNQQKHELAGKATPQAMQDIEAECDEWLGAGNSGHLCWGYFVFRKDD